MDVMNIIKGKIKGGKLVRDSEINLPEGTEVIILSRDDFVRLAGSDSTRHQLEQKEQELEQTRQEVRRLTDESNRQSEHKK